MLRNLFLLILMLVAVPCQAKWNKTPIWGEFANTDSTAATLTETTARIALFEMIAGVPTAVTLASTDIVELTDVVAGMAGAAGGATVTIYSGSNDTLATGEQMYKAIFVATGGISSSTRFTVPPRSIPGTYPKVEASAAALTSVYVCGYVWRYTP